MHIPIRPIKLGHRFGEYYFQTSLALSYVYHHKYAHAWGLYNKTFFVVIHLGVADSIMFFAAKHGNLQCTKANLQ
jgi:hypothetical protein